MKGAMKICFVFLKGLVKNVQTDEHDQSAGSFGCSMHYYNGTRAVQVCSMKPNQNRGKMHYVFLPATLFLTRAARCE